MATNFITYTGTHTLDLNSLQGKLVDIEAGGLRGLRTDQENFPAVVLELEQAVPVAGAAAGIPQDVYEHFLLCNQLVADIDQQLAIAQKQVEILRESRAFYVDARQNDIALIVDAMKSRAQRRKDESVLLSFEKTLKYNSQNGDKAARTRRRNAAAGDDTAPPAPPAGASVESPSPA
jgi:hypothetical protein